MGADWADAFAAGAVDPFVAGGDVAEGAEVSGGGGADWRALGFCYPDGAGLAFGGGSGGGADWGAVGAFAVAG